MEEGLLHIRQIDGETLEICASNKFYVTDTTGSFGKFCRALDLVTDKRYEIVTAERKTFEEEGYEYIITDEEEEEGSEATPDSSSSSAPESPSEEERDVEKAQVYIKVNGDSQVRHRKTVLKKVERPATFMEEVPSKSALSVEKTKLLIRDKRIYQLYKMFSALNGMDGSLMLNLRKFSPLMTISELLSFYQNTLANQVEYITLLEEMADAVSQKDYGIADAFSQKVRTKREEIMNSKRDKLH